MRPAMSKNPGSSVLILVLGGVWGLPAHAQSADPEAVQRELAAMRAQMARMAERIDTLEGQLAAANAKMEEAAAPVPKTPPKPEPQTETTWDGAPKLAGDDGWSFKPRGRIQADVGGVDAPRGVASGGSLGVAAEFRRIYLGVDGTMPGGFGYRVEANVANGDVELTDVFLSYKANPDLTLTLGHHKPFWGMEEMTSNLFTSFMERAAFNSAFGFERRLGFSLTYSDKLLLVQGGVFTDDAEDLDDSNNSFSLDGRVVLMPKLGRGQLHLGGSVHYRELNDLTDATRYSVRPFVHTTDVRFVDTGDITSVSAERSFGLEAAYIRGRFHASAEASWFTARRPGLPDPTFNGGYAEVGYLLTNDETVYKGGVYDRIRPRKPLGKGGIGAVQVNARYDWLDLSDAGIVGGRQRIAGLSVIWIPADHVRFIVNYGHLWLKDAAVPAGADRDFAADALGMRAQVDF